MTHRQPARQHPKAHVAPTSDTPRAGYYRARMAKGGVWVAVRIWYGPPHDPVTGEEMDRSWRWQAERNGERCETWDVWPYCAADEISQADHDYLLADRRWAATYTPGSVEANPRQRVDLNSLPVPQF